MLNGVRQRLSAEHQLWLHLALNPFISRDGHSIADAWPESEITRGRHVIVVFTRMIVRNLTSINDLVFRAKHAQILAVSGALVPLHDMYSADLEVLSPASSEGTAIGDRIGEGRYVVSIEKRTPFWLRAFPVLLELGNNLEEDKERMMKESGP
ncbi:hypothetical protein HGRIS_013957 [Hohenbuehelia grisea]|uniref:Uncharacterized protein n=1 Tax=Hohenbuehelia grisea TaxID=104357 RepID=A0ABR3JS38_9AGAR